MSDFSLKPKMSRVYNLHLDLQVNNLSDFYGLVDYVMILCWLRELFGLLHS